MEQAVRVSAASWPERTYLTIPTADERPGCGTFGFAGSCSANNAIAIMNKPTNPAIMPNTGLGSLAASLGCGGVEVRGFFISTR